MRKIEALMRPHYVEKLRKLLPESGMAGMTVTETVMWTLHVQESDHGKRFEWVGEPRIKVEIVVPESPENDLVLAVTSLVREIDTNAEIWTSLIETSLRIRTEDRNNESLT